MKQISRKDWENYIKALSGLSQKAAQIMQAFAEQNGLEDRDALIRMQYALATKYGEAAASLACQMYDAVAEASGAMVPPAEPAETATYKEAAIAVNGSLKQSPSGKVLPQTTDRLVKQAAADTTLKNALRDGAQFAWVPNGDTCAFCLTLASRGWQYASKKTIQGGHADHIHANCDCTFAIRFDNSTTVAGYDPDKYKRMYYDAGDTPRERLNTMRRIHYAENKDYINAQKRAAYALGSPSNTEAGRLARAKQREIEKEQIRAILSKCKTIGTPEVNLGMLRTTEFQKKFSRITSSSAVNDKLRRCAMGSLTKNSGTYTETLYIIDAQTGKTVFSKTGVKNGFGIDVSIDERKRIRDYKGKKIAIHNHPTNIFPTGSDFATAGARKYDFGLVVTHDGRVMKYMGPKVPVSARTMDVIIDKHTRFAYTEDDKRHAYLEAMKELERRFGVICQEIF